MRASPHRRLLALLALAFVPWTVVFGPITTFVFPFGLVEVGQRISVVPMWDFLFRFGGGLPRYQELLPVSILFYLVALAIACAGVVGRGNGRLVAASLVLAGVSHLGVALAFAHRLRYVGVPVGAVLLVAAAWWYYGDDLWALLRAPFA